jgi:hypothetical protein
METPCTCNSPINLETDSLCPACEEARETMDDLSREADSQAFADACGSMTREDWDADNDWLASAGWGEM